MIELTENDKELVGYLYGFGQGYDEIAEKLLQRRMHNLMWEMETEVVQEIKKINPDFKQRPKEYC